MKYQWRITKYNPANRNRQGHYLSDEWTCPSEIGKIINSELFTLEQYLVVEEAYIETVMAFLKETGLSTLRGIQVSEFQQDQASLLYEPEFSQLQIQEDMVLNLNEIRIVCRMILRNFADCHLYAKDRFFVHFGWDYYMYIGSDQDSLQAAAFAERSGLFVEACTSPYYFVEKDTIREVEWNEVGAEVPIIVGQEEIKDVPLDAYRRLFGLSEEHPVFGAFKITQDHQEFFQSKLNHRLDFSKYEYRLWAGC